MNSSRFAGVARGAAPSALVIALAFSVQGCAQVQELSSHIPGLSSGSGIEMNRGEGEAYAGAGELVVRIKIAAARGESKEKGDDRDVPKDARKSGGADPAKDADLSKDAGTAQDADHAKGGDASKDAAAAKDADKEKDAQKKARPERASIELRYLGIDAQGRAVFERHDIDQIAGAPMAPRLPFTSRSEALARADGAAGDLPRSDRPLDTRQIALDLRKSRQIRIQGKIIDVIDASDSGVVFRIY